MLDKNDIALLKDMFKEFGFKLDQRFLAFENKVDDKLDQRFLAFENRIDDKIDQRFLTFEAKIDQRFLASETKTNAKIDEKLTRSESFLLDEMDRLQRNMYKKFDTLEESVDELKQYYRITRLENDTLSILIQKIENLQDTVDNLQQRVYP